MFGQINQIKFNTYKGNMKHIESKNNDTEKCLASVEQETVVQQEITINKEEVITNDPVDSYSAEDLEMLYRITEAEATGQDIESKMNVVSVILNRVVSDRFPNTIYEVIFSAKQFSCVSDGRYYEVIISPETVEAVNNVIRNGVTNDGLYFCNLADVTSLSTQEWFRSLTYLFSDTSGHSFYR